MKGQQQQLHCHGNRFHVNHQRSVSSLSVAVASGVAGSKKRHVTGSSMAPPPTHVEPSAPPMTSSSDCDVVHHVTCGPETSRAPLCRRCGAAVPACDDVTELPPPSYEQSQQLRNVNHLTQCRR